MCEWTPAKRDDFTSFESNFLFERWRVKVRLPLPGQRTGMSLPVPSTMSFWIFDLQRD